MELYSKEQIKQIVINEYNGDLGNGVINRYCNHYLSRIDYHKLLLNGKDKIEVEINLSPFQIKEKVYDFVTRYFNRAIASSLSLELKNNKVYINSGKPIKAILNGIKKYNEEAKKVAELENNLYRIYNLTKAEETLQHLDLTTTFKVIISAKPEDFINCSDNTTGWQSCFRKEGEYHTSTNAFYTDDRMLISYITTPNGKKIGRRWLHIDYDNQVVCSGKEYGTYPDNVDKAVREYVQALINKDVKWYSFKQDNIFHDVQACYQDNNYTISYIEGNKNSDYCMYMEMEDGLNNEDEVGEGTWYSEGTMICEECGRRHHADDSYYIEQGDYYVCDCCIDNYTYCDYHNRYESNEDIDFYSYGRYGNRTCIEGAVDSGEYVYDINGEVINLDEAIYLEDCDVYIYENTFNYIYLEDEEYYVSTNYPYIIHNGNYYSENYIIEEEDNEEAN